MGSKSRISLRGLRTFCVAAAEENFSAAGDVLFVTPSAVSHQIRSLEEELGHRLFDRNARELKLTEKGRALYEEVNPLIEQIEDIVSAARFKPVNDPIRMSVQPFFASEYFVPRLSEFTSDRPDVDIRVSASDESAESLPADAHLSIRLYKRPPSGVESQLLFPLRLAPAGSRSLRQSLEVKDGRIRNSIPLIVHESFPKAWKQWSKASGIALPEESRITRLDSMIAVVRAVEQGIGAALVPVPIANQWFEQKTIFRLFDEELVARESYYAIWDKEALAKPGVDALLTWILERFAVSE